MKCRIVVLILLFVLILAGCDEATSNEQIATEPQVKQTTVKETTKVEQTTIVEETTATQQSQTEITESKWQGIWKNESDNSAFGEIKITDVTEDGFRFSMEAFLVNRFFNDQGLEIENVHMGFLEGKAQIVAEGKAVYLSEEIEDYAVVFYLYAEDGFISISEMNTKTNVGYGYSPLAGANVRHAGKYIEDSQIEVIEKEEKDSVDIMLAFTSKEEKDSMEIIEYTDYTNKVVFTNAADELIYESAELNGEFVSSRLLDFNGDGLSDVLIEIDKIVGGSPHAYHVYSYDEVYGIKHYNLEVLHPENIYNVSVSQYEMTLERKDTKEITVLRYPQKVLEDLESSEVTQALWLPQEIKVDINEKGELTFRTKATVTVESWAFEIGEVETKYVFVNNTWGISESTIRREPRSLLYGLATECIEVGEEKMYVEVAYDEGESQLVLYAGENQVVIEKEIDRESIFKNNPDDHYEVVLKVMSNKILVGVTYSGTLQFGSTAWVYCYEYNDDKINKIWFSNDLYDEEFQLDGGKVYAVHIPQYRLYDYDDDGKDEVIVSLLLGVEEGEVKASYFNIYKFSEVGITLEKSVFGDSSEGANLEKVLSNSN